MRIYINVIFPDCSYSEGLAKAGFTTLYDRRSTLCKELFSVIVTQGNHKLSHLLPVRSQQNYNLRSTHAFAAPVCKTNRFRDSFIISHCMQYILNSRYIFIVNTLFSRNSANWPQGVFINKRSYYYYYYYYY